MAVNGALCGCLWLFVAGCAPAYVYVPDDDATAMIAGRTAADYLAPPEHPTGDVRVASFGFADLTLNGGDATDADHFRRALHLRMVVSNNSAQPWTLDTREQRLDLERGGESAPVFSSANANAHPPIVMVPSGGKRVVDLFFALPDDQQTAKKIPHFDAVWTVHTDSRAVTERVPFSRVLVEPTTVTYEDYGPDYWWGAPYYYDGSSVGFVGVTPFGAHWRESGPRGIYIHGYRYGGRAREHWRR